MRDKTNEEMIAVVNVAISNPGTNFEVPHRRNTLIKKAAIPKVKIEIGRAINWSIGLMKVFTTPIATAATIAVHRFARVKPGTRYSTTRRANTLIASRIIRPINQVFFFVVSLSSTEAILSSSLEKSLIIS